MQKLVIVILGILFLSFLSAPRCTTVTCNTNQDCSRNEFCLYAEGECKEPGICTKYPEVCPEIYAPVCGCDGKTYGNDCYAYAEGMSIDYQGECK